MEDKINQVQRTISKLVSMIDSGEQNSIQSRSDALQALLTLEEIKEEIKNGVNTKENELPTPSGDKEVCPHPLNKVLLLNGWYRCAACNGKWKSKIK